jgi:putative YphP/YqiW family bacilliredoxin
MQQRYPEMMIAPMRREIAELGAEELKTAEAVDAFMDGIGAGTAMVVVNSVCGCSAGSMRPGLALALQRGLKPDAFATVFAGADTEATERVRQHFLPHPPSSPAIAVFRDGELATMVQRQHIQGRAAEDIATALLEAFGADTAASA